MSLAVRVFFVFLAFANFKPSPSFAGFHGNLGLNPQLRTVPTIPGIRVPNIRNNSLTATQIHVHNKCSKELQLAMHFQKVDGTWTTKGWYTFAPGEKAFLAETKHRLFYLYAESQNSKWTGDDFTGRVRGSNEMYSFFETDAGDGFKIFTQNLTCQD